jgi:hypothetical protein
MSQKISLFLLGCFLSFSAYAQLHVEISGVGASQIPIAVASFTNEDIAPQNVSRIIKDDLLRSGYFKLIDAPSPLSETDDIHLANWKSAGADALLVGSVYKTNDGRFDVRYKLFDVDKASTLSAFAIAATPQYIRVTGHKIADDVFEKLTGIRGIFATRIAYVTKNSRGYQLEIADADGDGVQIAFRSKEPIMSPSWSPDGTKIAYVSFESKKPIVYVQNLMTGARKMVANFKGKRLSRKGNANYLVGWVGFINPAFAQSAGLIKPTQPTRCFSHPEHKVLIQGNTDERGGQEYNLALGQKRAVAVTKTLSVLGVPESQMEAVSLGKEKPKALGHDEDAWAENRRADIVY